MTDAFIIKSMSEEHRRLVYKAFLEFAKKGETTAEFMARMCVDWCIACLAEKECIDKQAAGLYGDILRPLNMNPEITEEAKEKTEHLDYNSMYPDFEKSEKDCIWERD